MIVYCKITYTQEDFPVVSQQVVNEGVVHLLMLSGYILEQHSYSIQPLGKCVEIRENERKN